MPIGNWQEPEIKLLLDMFKFTINHSDPDVNDIANALDGGSCETDMGLYYLQELAKDYDLDNVEVTINLTPKGN